MDKLKKRYHLLKIKTEKSIKDIKEKTLIQLQDDVTKLEQEKEKLLIEINNLKDRVTALEGV